MKAKERIIIDPKVQHGKPVIRGTRVPVARIIAELAGGMTREEVMHQYAVSAEDITLDEILTYCKVCDIIYWEQRPN